MFEPNEVMKAAEKKLVADNPLYKNDIILKVACDELPYTVNITMTTVTMLSDILSWISENGSGKFSFVTNMCVLDLTTTFETTQALLDSLQPNRSKDVTIYFEYEEDAIMFKLWCE